MGARGALAAAGCALLVAACASFDGRTLVPGTSRAAEVEALMGPPAEILDEAGGDAVWFYPRGWARFTYAVRIGPDGVVRSVEQRLTRENLKYIVPDSSQMKDVRAVFGPPLRVYSPDRRDRVTWEYRTYHLQDPRVMWVHFSADGVVREVIEMIDWEAENPLGGPFRKNFR